MTETLTAQLIRHEGKRLKPYVCTEGKITIGYGRNLTDVGISETEARAMLSVDIAKAVESLHHSLPWVATLPLSVHDVLANMTFNMGIHGLLEFRRFLAAVRAGEWQTAAVEMLDSRWAEQVGYRAQELADVIRGQA